MYYPGDYVWMIADGPRVDAYAAAIRAVVRPGCRVIDLGAGFGFFSVLAVKAGAAHVDAIEPNQIVHLGPRFAADNDCADKITFHPMDACEVSLAEPSDVLIADLRGPTPFCGTALQVIIDARDRLLKPGGAIIAMRDTLYVAPCAAPLTFRREIDAAHGREGVDLGAVERVIFDTPIRCRIEADVLRAEPRAWTEIDYRALAQTDACGTVEWSMDRDARLRGLAVWFESDLAPGVRLSPVPSTAAPYGQMFVPFSSPLIVRAGDALRIEIGARLVQQDYVWTWRARVNGRLTIDQNSLAERVIDPRLLAFRGAIMTGREGI